VTHAATHGGQAWRAPRRATTGSTLRHHSLLFSGAYDVRLRASYPYAAAAAGAAAPRAPFLPHQVCVTAVTSRWHHTCLRSPLLRSVRVRVNGGLAVTATLNYARAAQSVRFVPAPGAGRVRFCVLYCCAAAGWRKQAFLGQR